MLLINFPFDQLEDITDSLNIVYATFVLLSTENAKFLS